MLKLANKLNQLLQRWPKGTVAVLPWLAQQGVSQSLARRYVISGWITPVGRGVFIRAGDKVGWEGALYALQHQLGKSVHPGGRTALELSGRSHFVALGTQRTVFIFVPPKERLPKWFKDRKWGSTLRIRYTALFGGSAHHLGLSEHQVGEFALSVSAPERAILEALDGHPKHLSFSEARLLVEGLITLRPTVVQKLLEACDSVKVKRVFLYLAREAGHAWYRRLDLSRINLGKGKRVIERDGHLDPQFLITVPTSDPS